MSLKSSKIKNIPNIPHFLPLVELKRTYLTFIRYVLCMKQFPYIGFHIPFVFPRESDPRIFVRWWLFEAAMSESFWWNKTSLSARIICKSMFNKPLTSSLFQQESGVLFNLSFVSRFDLPISVRRYCSLTQYFFSPWSRPHVCNAHIHTICAWECMRCVGKKCSWEKLVLIFYIIKSISN